MVRLNIFFVFLFIIILESSVFAQKLNEDGYKVSIESINKQEMGFCGKKNDFYVGIFKAKSKSLKGKYIFKLSQLSNDKSMLMIQSFQNETFDPVLIYDTESNSFYYTENKEKAKEVSIDKALDMENKIAKGLLFWLKIKNELNSKVVN